MPPSSRLFGTKHGKQPDVEAFNGSRFKSPKRSRTFDPLDDWTGKRESRFDPAAIKSFKRFQRFCRPVIYNLGKEKLCRCHDLSVDEILNFMAFIDQIPTHHPLVGSHQLLFRNWFSRLDKYYPVKIEVVDGQCLNFGALFVVDEVVQVTAFVRVNPPYSLAERPIDCSIGFYADFRCRCVRSIVKSLDNQPAAVLLGNRNPGLTDTAGIYRCRSSSLCSAPRVARC